MIRHGVLAILLGMTAVVPHFAGDSWPVELSTVDGDDFGVAYAGALRADGAAGERPGVLVSTEHRLSSPADRVRARVDADRPAGVEVDVRGRIGEDWTEWLPAGELFPRAVQVVQARISVSGPAAVRAVTLSADRVARVESPPSTVALGYRIFATREGLVGGTTSNGHKIVERDHFVSFPSTKSVSPKGTGNYTARVCLTDGTRCEYAPVWEVGPWNTHDDYWNPAGSRAQFPELPQGVPEAQAAYNDGFNGGKDSRGRTVRNPAGVDLADGTFWDGLGLTGNSYVDITYLWTGAATATAIVSTAGAPLNLRPNPATSAAAIGYAANYAQIPIECSVSGQSVSGTYGTSAVWDRIGPGHYLAEAYVRITGVVPPCDGLARDQRGG
ncbi:hypothetical protein [Amycolatopsis panacis]|uniref:Uncharacterized protein n=1 Tax=Amycolatopsis panacis TaxID=2340917 RepID=A0A419I9T7_9PSEU|nr:hypothetical protein [Amycolatopsis panacis]RJQ89663.1 hypothetical protein D5S19_04245 [Amycolatopsis panacis]